MAKLLPHSWAVPQVFRERLGSQGGRQRTMVADGHLLLVLHEPPEPGVPERKHRLFWRSPEGSWQATVKPAGLGAVYGHLDGFTRAVDELEARLATARAAADYFAVLQAATPLVRTARHLWRAMQDAREGVPKDHDLIVLRDKADDVQRAAELVHEHAEDGLAFALANAAEEQARQGADIARASHRLNLLAAMFFPVTAIATIFGMQLDNGFGQSGAPFVFWGVVAAAFVLGLGLRASLAPRT